MQRAIRVIAILSQALVFSTSWLAAKEADTAQKNKVVAVLKRDYPGLEAKSIALKSFADVHLQKVFRQTRFYQVSIFISLPPKRISVAELNQDIVPLPREFNRLLATAGIKLTDNNALDVAYAFCQLADPEAIPYMRLNNAEAPIRQVNAAVKIVRFSTYSRLGGIVKDWEFTFNWDRVSKAVETVSQKNHGDYIRPSDEYDSYHRSLGIPKIYLPLPYQSSGKPEQGQLVPSVKTDKNYVTIRENGSPTSQTERTVNVIVSGFDANTEMTIKATSFGGTDGDFLNVKVTTDGNGGITYTWVVDGSASQASDLAVISATGKVGNMEMTENLPEFSEGPFALQDKFYNPDQFNVDPDLALTIYYCTGYENYVGATVEAFKNSVRAAMVASYVKQVTEWKFMRPFDQDQDYYVYINDGMNEFHDSKTTAARSGEDRKMWIQSDIFSGYNNYSSAHALINVVVAHEFFHGIQYGYHPNHLAIWSNNDAGDWIIEGQARFIQSVQYESEEFADAQHLYPRDANLYLQQNLNSSLKANTYNYCIYWRFLYENYRSATTESDKVRILERALMEAASQEAAGRDAVVGGELAMNTALSGGGGVYNTFDASIDNFAKANYILKLDDADPSQRYSHVATYSDPAIAARIVYAGTTEEITGDIPASFGMDFIEVSFTAPNNAATFSFDGGSGDKFATNDDDDFQVTLLVIDNNRLVSEKTLTLDGASEEGQLELTGIGNDSGDKVAVIVARLDSKEGDAKATGNYKLKVAPSVDIALVLDRSGSMAGQKIIDAKNSAKTFVGFMQTGDKIGVVSFANSASVNFPLTTIVAEATKTAAQNAINGISANGATSIGAGMQLGQGELNKGDPNHPHAMLLLSDGQENTPPNVADVLPTIPKETDIYTIGLGADAAGQLLGNIASTTGGEYNFAPSSAKLQEIYQRIQGKITKQQTLISYTGTISQGNTLTHAVTVDALISRAIFSLTFQGSDVDLDLVAPNGQLIDPQVAATDPNIDYTEGATFDFYTILTPAAGQWTLRLKGVDVPTPESYFTTVQVSSQLKMEVTLDKSEYNAGEPVLISANLKENAQAITGAAVSAEVTVPTTNMSVDQQWRASFMRDEDAEANNLGSAFESNNSLSSTEALQFIAETVTLFDDGNHSDGAANDGVYANFFRNTAKDGSYTFTVRASGTASQAGAFMRETAFSTFVKPSTNPLVISVQPNSGQTGQTLNVTITGANFANGATVSFSGTGITVNARSFVSATQLTANISIAANAAQGARDVIVRNPNGQSTTAASLFNVLGCGPSLATVSDNFESGTDNWLALTPTSWGINLIGSDQVFCLSVPNAIRDEYVVQRGEPWLDFDLTLEAKSDATSNKNFFIIFGTTDFRNAASNGYYLQFALGGVKLYRSTGGGRGVEMASATRDYVSDNLFHRIRLERKLPSLKVAVDGVVVININDGAFAIGSIGFGSFNSQACFDDVNITGTRAEPDFYIDAFDDGDADGWSPLTPSRWQVGNESGSLRYFINMTNYEPPNSARLGELALRDNKTLSDFVFECHAKSADAAARNENADLCLVFGYQDFDSYYYVNFNSAPGLTQLFRTHNGVNTVLATFNQSTFTEGDAAYHALRLERTGSQIRAFFDGIPVLAATDNFFGAGQIGIGSYNDSGYFDNLALTGGCSTPSNKIPVTFQVNLAVQICENTFAPATDQLNLRGSFNGFVDGVDVLTDPDGDGIYTTVVEFEASTAGATIDYKYSFLHAGQTVVENLPNRQFTIPAGGGVVPLVFFNNDNQCNRNASIFPTAASPQTAGSEFVVDVNIGDNTNPISNLFGVSFELNYTNTTFIDVVAPANANVTPGPLLGNDVIFVFNVDEPSGKVSIGVSRKAGQAGVNGNGVVARVKFKSLAATPNGTTVTFDLRNVTANDPPGNAIALAAASATITITSGIIVWPGDTNNDKIVNQADVLPLGVHWNQTGPKRPNASSAWIGQPAISWSPIAATYADANGDGVVNQADVLPIGVNFGRTHTTLYPLAETGDESTLLSKTNAATISTTFTGNTNPGQDFDLDVVVNEVTGLFGVSFELLYSPATLLDPQATSAGSFMGNDPIFFDNTDKAAGKISVGVSRKAGQTGVTGAGVVAKIKMRVSSQAVRGQAITFTLQNVTANDANGQAMSLSVSPGPPLLVSVVSRRLVALPTAFALHQNSPNPFNPSTEIFYDLPEASDVQVAIFDMLGKHVRTLVHERQVAGSYSIFWDGRDENGRLVASGVFIAHLRVADPVNGGAGKFVQGRKMLLVR